jgi:hypothetical protein
MLAAERPQLQSRVSRTRYGGPGHLSEDQSQLDGKGRPCEVRMNR